MNPKAVIYFTILLLVASLILLFWPGSEESNDNVLRRNNGAEPETLDPQRITGVPGANIVRDLFEGLVSIADDGSVEPAAATAWEISDDGLTYTFYLREDLRWSNGDKLTADDFVYGLQRAVDPMVGSPYADQLEMIVNVWPIIRAEKARHELGVIAIDDDTLQINLQHPTPFLLDILANPLTYPAHQASIEKYQDQFAQEGKLVSNGAFQLDDWVVGDKIVLTRNPYYWDKTVKLDQVHYYSIENMGYALNLYLAGQLDMLNGIPSEFVDYLRQEHADEMIIAPTLGIYFYAFNLNKPPFNLSKKLRQALTMLVDRKVITEVVTGLQQQPLYSLVPPGLADYANNKYEWADWSRQQQIDYAVALYSQACAEVIALGCADNKALTIELLYNTSEGHKNIAIAIDSMWDDYLNINIELLNQEWKVFLDNRRKGNYELARHGWVADYADPDTFLQLFRSDNPLNESFYVNKQFDYLMTEANQTINVEKRMALLSEAERLAMQDYPIIPIYSYTSLYVVKPYIKGFSGKSILGHYPSKSLYKIYTSHD